MITLENIIIFALALNSLLILWFHEDSFLATLRARTELWDNFLGRSLNCRLCLSYQLPFWLLLLPYWAVSSFVVGPWSWLILLPVYSLATHTVAMMIGGAMLLLWQRKKAEWLPNFHKEVDAVAGAIVAIVDTAKPSPWPAGEDKYNKADPGEPNVSADP